MNGVFPQFHLIKKLHLVLGVLFLFLLGACTPAEEKAEDISIDSVSPNSGDLSGGYTVTLNGSNFSYIESVKFGDASCTNMTISKNKKEMSCTVPAGSSPGNVSISIKGKAQRSATASFTYVLTSPTVTSISPAIGPLLGGANLFIYGSGFKTGTVVTIDGSLCVGTVISSNLIECATPAKAQGSYAVLVTNPNGTYSVAPTTFTYNPVPTISSVTPNYSSTQGGATLTITGTNFFSGAKVQIGSLNCTSVQVVSSTTITCVTPHGTAGVYDLKVTNQDTQWASSSGFTYIEPPYINTLSPNAGALGGGTTVTVNGLNFLPTSTVEIDGESRPVTYVSSTKITFVTPARTAGSYTVSVRNPGTVADTNTYTFQEAPTISSLSPQSGPLEGDATLTINGTFFRTGVTVTIGGDTCTVKTVTSSKITCKTPAKTAGSYDVIVLNTDQQSATVTNGYSYQASPTVSSVTPNTGPTVGGTEITISGTNFSNPTVKVGTSDCNITSSTSNSIVCETTTGAAGSVSVTVINDDLQEAVLENGFQYIGQPVLKFQVGSGSPTPPNPDNFGSTTTNVTHTFTVTNEGDVSSAIVLFSISGANPGAFSIGTTTCLGALAQGNTCFVQVNFEGASLGSGTYNAVLEATPSSGIGATNALQGTVP